jgi:hypothetical protein
MASVTPGAKPAPPTSAKPGTQDSKGAKPPKEKKERVPRVDYTVPEGGLKEWPKDWNPKQHKPLRRKDFADEGVYLEERAKRYEAMAVRIRQEIADGKKLGTLKEKGKAKKLLQLQRKFDELKKQLIADDVDVDAILATIGSEAEAPAAAEAPKG